MSRSFDLSRSFRETFGSFDRFGESPFRSLNASFELASQNVRYFYLASALFVWMRILPWHNLGVEQPPLEAVWPILWATHLPLLELVDILSVACATFATLAFWKPSLTIFRAAFAVTLLLVAAISASTGAINHGEHEWFWVSFVFIFLPTANDRVGRLSYCLTFAAAQALVLMFYTLAGFWKLLFGLRALLNGAPGNFSPDALAWTLADRMLQTGTQPLLGPFFVDNPWAGWAMFYILVYAQLSAIVIAFRPSLHLAWGALLIMFHTGTFLLMEITFPTHILILMVLFIASPFQRPDWFKARTFVLMPIFGDLYSAFAKKDELRARQAGPCVT